MQDKLPSRDLVLVGAGHTHAHIIRMWRMNPIADVRMTLVTPYARATYSGMLPGTLAGCYTRDDMEIDLYRLCAACGVGLIVDEVIGLDPDARRIRFRDRPPMRYDVCSVGIGSVPSGREIWARHPEVLSIKPMATFLERLERRLGAIESRPVRIHVVGAGAAGVEVSFCLDAMLRARGIEARIELVDGGDEILSGYGSKLISIVRDEMARRGIDVRGNQRATGYSDGRLELRDGEPVASDMVIWATRAAPPPVLDGFDLPKAPDGFLAVDRTLQSTGGYPVFAVGDTASMIDLDVPKAGVYAVREGPVLWHNLERMFRGEPLRRYKPQSGFLSLLALGDNRAAGQYKGFAASGGWVWKVKDHIDRTFMRKHQDVEPMTEEMMAEREDDRRRTEAGRGDEAPAMRCRGCGGKVGAGVLDAALSRLDIPPSPFIKHGLDAPDDAALLDPAAGPLEVVSVDFFQSFLDDPYIVGRVAALNAISDLYAMGSQPVAAMAMVTLPEGPTNMQAELLYQLLAGGLRELSAAGGTLLGGHTTEAAELTIGYTVFGQLNGLAPFLKGGLRQGDRLVLTKPLGTATLLAGLPLCETRAIWMDALLQSMLQSNAAAAACAREADATGVTDVTGFGLAGHLLEMLDASGLDARLDLERLPLLPGFAELASRGIESSLASANREIESRVDIAHPDLRALPAYRALYDPQTSGGMLIAVAPDRLDELLDKLRDGGSAAVIGEVTGQSQDPTITATASTSAGDTARRSRPQKAPA